MRHGITNITLFAGIGLGYTNNTVTENFYDRGDLVKTTVRKYHTFVFLFLKFFWITGDGHSVDINVRPTPSRPTPVVFHGTSQKETPWKHKMT